MDKTISQLLNNLLVYEYGDNLRCFGIRSGPCFIASPWYPFGRSEVLTEVYVRTAPTILMVICQRDGPPMHRA